MRLNIIKLRRANSHVISFLTEVWEIEPKLNNTRPQAMTSNNVQVIDIKSTTKERNSTDNTLHLHALTFPHDFSGSAIIHSLFLHQFEAHPPTAHTNNTSQSLPYPFIKAMLCCYTKPSKATCNLLTFSLIPLASCSGNQTLLPTEGHSFS